MQGQRFGREPYLEATRVGEIEEVFRWKEERLVKHGFHLKR